MKWEAFCLSKQHKTGRETEQTMTEFIEDYRANVSQSVTREFEEFKARILENATPEDIFEKAAEIFYKTTLSTSSLNRQKKNTKKRSTKPPI